ncbi:Suppressor APC domain-containing protein 2 [Armadillidium nasatum]|uniref:Suppressor APC domain-containing protein 2 n=2 Tax=Armadillidium nasatum TaxID=96803 RepID=A0A5N5TMT2_9CRUS|nr:Suppressor APC domain-containing protein 2 [Armadillidium nasatum]
MTATHNIPVEGSTSVEGLPKSFVCSMRTLFDIMDDQHTGYIRFSGLPEGVLSNLRKVTPPNGFLSFDRFCAGLKNCLLKKRERDENAVPSLLSSIHLSSLSPTNSLEVIPPLKASSPQTSPRNKNRPLSAPLLDQEIYPQQPISNKIFYNEMNGTRVSQEKATHYPNDFINKPLVPSSQHKHNINSKTHGTKLDIRMGVGGIKGMSSKGLSNNHQSSSSGPPKPPRSQDVNEIPFSQHSSAPSNNVRMTNSLERESRSEKRWNRESGCPSNEPIVRKDRGGSLERLLDAEGHKLNSDTNNYGPPLNRTGMRSALQTWFKERSKSDLQKVGKDSIIRKDNKRYIETNKEKRVPPSYQLAIETAYRGNSENITHRRNNSSSILKSHVGRNSTMTVSQNSNQNRLRVALPPPPHALPYTNNNPNSNYNDANKIYGKTMETVVAVPAGYNPTQNTQGERDVKSSSVGNGPIAHGLYVAPQPPQVAVHKKTSKKKESRRHTLQNGVDQNAMKRLRQLEAERDMLYQGLDVVERARIWYKMQLQNVSERIHYLPFGPLQAEPSMESQQEKLHFQLARIHEINAHLRALMDAQEKGIPAHMNLAVRGSFLNGRESDSDKENAVHRLKQQNKLLTDEVSVKSERITSLEHEKAALLRELFQARAAHRPANADSTFM